MATTTSSFSAANFSSRPTSYNVGSVTHRPVRYGRKCWGSRWNRVVSSMRSLVVSFTYIYIHLLSIAAQIDRLDNVQWHNIQTVQFNNKQKIRCYKRIWNLLRAYTINDFLSFCVRANGTGYGCAFLSRLNTILSRLSGIRWLRQEFGFNILLKKIEG